MQLKNYMEDLVWERVDEIIAGTKKACSCPKCRFDVVALALNALPPRYVVTDQGETYAKIRGLEAQFNVDVLTAVSNAIVVVNGHPRHDEK
ncbi:MAG TPA: late competence development ComFB family protein [Patescibacteria group bacterium]|nr:late competence development ComFB family protein [Patescibacteria group bacterium]